MQSGPPDLPIVLKQMGGALFALAASATPIYIFVRFAEQNLLVFIGALVASMSLLVLSTVMGAFGGIDRGESQVTRTYGGYYDPTISDEDESTNFISSSDSDVFESSFSYDSYDSYDWNNDHHSNFDFDDSTSFSPMTNIDGSPMIGDSGIDINGHTYGSV